MTLPFQNFLTIFQSDAPMLPFLNEILTSLMRSLMTKIVRPEVIQSATTSLAICNIDVMIKDNLKDATSIDIGTAALLEVNKAMQISSTTPQLRKQFYRECRLFIVSAILKLQEKNPLKYKFVRNCSSLSPSLVVNDADDAKRRFRHMTLQLHSLKRISSVVADMANTEFDEFLSTVVPSKVDTFKEFSYLKNRLDTFFMDMFQKQFQNVATVVKITMSLFHGNANVERGFSVSVYAFICNNTIFSKLCMFLNVCNFS